MYQDKYYVTKSSNTFSDMLEAIGLSYFLQRLMEEEDLKIRIKDKGMYYELKLSVPIDEDVVEYAEYFNLFKYVKTKSDKKQLDSVDFIDYEEENKKKKQYDDIVNNAKENRKELIAKLEEEGLKPDDEWFLISSVNALKGLSTYQKLFLNVYKNKTIFKEIVKLILELYSSPINNESNVKKKLKKLQKEKILKDISNVNSIQLINPDKVKGANSAKSRSMKSGPIGAFWLREYLKIGGIFKSMVIKNVKINNRTWDTKAYVIGVKQLDFNKLQIIYNRFSNNLKGITAVKLDIFSLLYLCTLLIQYKKEFDEENTQITSMYNIRSYITGFYTVYYKNMGNASSPTNISFLELPDFITVDSKEKGLEWIDILNEHMDIIRNIKISAQQQDETGLVLSILQRYRHFLTSSSLNVFLDFIIEYCVFLMQQIDKKNFYVRPFTKKNMEVFFMNVDKNYGEVLQNKGFQNIAKAIRNSTISAQYQKSRNDNSIKYPIKYGLAQDIKRKAPYKDELIEYISDFISWYNAETARIAERNPNLLKEGKIRATVKYQDIEDFISLLDDGKYSSNVIGKLLCAYGYSLDRKENDNDNENKDK